MSVLDVQDSSMCFLNRSCFARPNSCIFRALILLTVPSRRPCTHRRAQPARRPHQLTFFQCKDRSGAHNASNRCHASAADKAGTSGIRPRVAASGSRSCGTNCNAPHYCATANSCSHADNRRWVPSSWAGAASFPATAVILKPPPGHATLTPATANPTAYTTMSSTACAVPARSRWV